MKTILFMILCISFAVLCGYAQQKQGHAPTPNKRGIGKGRVVDHAKISVWYAMNADNVEDMKTYIDFQRLDVGDSIVKYYSWFLFCSDSLRADWEKKNPNSHAAPRWMGEGGKNKDRWCQYQHSDFYIKNGLLTEYACMPHALTQYNSYYSEPYPQMMWELVDEHQGVMGYDCQKATCHWRGRDYVAWFAPSIPVRRGPWKFGGLPGLILKVYDTQRLYTFEATAIEKGRYPIMRHEYKAYKKSKRADVQKHQRAFAENWYKASEFRKGTILPNGQMELGEYMSVHTNYEPLELE